MTEDDARAVLLLQAVEAEPPGALWTAEDRLWATRAAGQEVPADASRADRLRARARLAMQRLAPRDAAVRRLLAARGWRPAWVTVAGGLGLVLGMVSDGLVAGPYFNLLSPLFWGLLAWNAVLYAMLAANALRRQEGWLRGSLARRLLGRWRGQGVVAGFGARWAQAAEPLAGARAAALLHAVAGGVGLGLIAGLLLRGLVLDYRAGWATTLLDAETVRAALAAGLQPALALLGQSLPAGAAFDALRVTPASPAQASAAPWLLLMAAQLALWIVLPRALLLALALRRSARLTRDFPIDLASPAFDRWLAQPSRALWVLPHGAAPSPQAAAGLRAMLAAGFGDGVAVHWAEPLPWGDEDHPPPPPPGARAVLLVDLAATPEAEVQGRLVQSLAAADPIVVADRAGFVRRFGTSARLAEREAAWRALMGDRPFVSVALDAPDPAVAAQALRAALDT
jgi:hypothetical protein